MNLGIKKNLSLINQFSKLKLPWWLLVIPIFNNVIYLIIFKSWFVEFDDRKFISKYYRKTNWKINSFFLISIFLLYCIFTCVFFTVIKPNNYKIFEIFADYFYLIIIAIFTFFIFFTMSLNLYFEPKKVKKKYYKYLKKNHFITINWNTVNNNLIVYNLKKSFFQIKNNLFKLTYYSLFNSDNNLVKKVESFDNNKTIFDKELLESKVISNISFRFFIAHIILFYFWIRPIFCYFWYLFSTGFWFLCTLFLIYKLLKIENKFFKIIKITASIYSIVWLTINLLIFVFFLGFSLSDKFNWIYFFSINALYLRIILVLIINFLYINVLGLSLNFYFKSKINP